MIFKRSKRPRLFFSNLSRNCIPVVCEKSAHHQLTWLTPEARRMSTAVLLSPFHELRYLIRGFRPLRSKIQLDWTRFGKLSLQLLKRQWSKIIDLLENARDRRHGIRIRAQFLALVSLFGERFLLRHHGSYKAGRTGNYEDRQ